MRRKPILLALIVSAFFLLNLPGASSAPPTLVAPVLSASVTGTEVSLRWTDAGRENSYYVVRLPQGGVTWTTVAQLPANTLQYKDSGLSPSTTYQYIVVATRGWKQLNSNAVQVTTGVSPSPSPSPAPSPAPSPSPSTSPSPTSCSGVTVVPTSDIQALLNQYASGTTFCFQTGSYVLKTFLVPKSYDRLIGLPGAVLTGLDTYASGIKGYGGSTGQHDVTVRGFTIEHFRNAWTAGTLAALNPGWNWTIEKNEVRYNSQAGISVSNGSVIRGNNIHHNGHIGITGGPVSGVLIESNEIAFNNTGSYDTGHAGGVKLFGGSASSTNLVIRGNWVHHNTSHGLFFDTNVRNVTIEGNTIENNSYTGILYETSWDAVIRSNVVRNNAAAYAGKSCFSASQIHLNDSQNVEIYGNTVASSDGSNGICAVDIARTLSASASAKVANLNVHDNAVKVRLTGTTGLVGRPSSYDAAAYNRFTHNTYYVTNTSNKAWAWSTYPVAWSQWRGYGNDTTGSILIW